MGIFGRMSRVIKSNLNSLVDHAEDPGKLIDQTVLDMERELKNARKELITTVGTAKRLLAKAKEHETLAADWENKAALAVREGDDDLAREALKRKAVAKADAHGAVQQAQMAESAAERMKTALDAVEKRIEDLKARKGVLAQQVRQARSAGSSLTSPASGEGGAFADLDQMSNRIEALEAEVEASQVLDEPGRADVEARFRALEKQAGNTRVEDELAALKSKLRG